MRFEDRLAALAALRWIAFGLVLLLLFSYLLYLIMGTWAALEILDELLPKFLKRNELLESLVLR